MHTRWTSPGWRLSQFPNKILPPLICTFQCSWWQSVQFNNSLLYPICAHFAYICGVNSNQVKATSCSSAKRKIMKHRKDDCSENMRMNHSCGEACSVFRFFFGELMHDEGEAFRRKKTIECTISARRVSFLEIWCFGGLQSKYRPFLQYFYYLRHY